MNIDKYTKIILTVIALNTTLMVGDSLLSKFISDALALSIDASDIDGLTYYIEDTVEDCSVSGEVYLYSEQYGEIEGGSISC